MKDDEVIPSERTFWFWFFFRLYRVKTFMYWYNSGMSLEGSWRRGRAQTWKEYLELKSAPDFDWRVKEFRAYIDWLAYLYDRRRNK